MLTAPAHTLYGDEAEYLAIARQIVLRGEISFPPSVVSANGLSESRTYSKFPLGQTLLLVPFAAAELALGRALPLASLILDVLPALESAGMCALLFLLVRRVGSRNPDLRLSRRTAVLIAAAVGLGTQLWPSSRILFADQSAAFFLTVALYALVIFREAGQPPWLFAAASAAAVSVLCKNIFLLACPALLGYGFFAAKRSASAASRECQRSIGLLTVLALLPFVIVAAVQLSHNEVRYGSLWTFGYESGRDADYGFATPVLVGIYGILLSSGRSIFLYSPLCILALFGAQKFFKHAPAEGALIGGVSLPLIIVYAKWWSWHGGWEWGTRFYLFLIPPLVLLSIPVWRSLDGISLRRFQRWASAGFLGILLAVSIAVQILGVTIHPMSYWEIMASEVRVFEHSRYRKDVWEIRDDSLLPHFVPEFSPVAAHAWLLWATWNRDKLSERELSVAAPWVSLKKEWAPQNIRRYLGYDWWVTGFRNGAARPASLASKAVLSGILLMGLGYALVKLKRVVAGSD